MSQPESPLLPKDAFDFIQYEKTWDDNEERYDNKKWDKALDYLFPKCGEIDKDDRQVARKSLFLAMVEGTILSNKGSKDDRYEQNEIRKMLALQEKLSQHQGEKVTALQNTLKRLHVLLKTMSKELLRLDVWGFDVQDRHETDEAKTLQCGEGSTGGKAGYTD